MSISALQQWLLHFQSAEIPYQSYESMQQHLNIISLYWQGH